MTISTKLSTPHPALKPARDGWFLTAEGGAIHWDERVAVIADVHLGYEWARGVSGDCVLAHSLAETQAKLERMLARVRVTRLVVAGDFVESSKPCQRTARDVERLSTWLGERGVDLVVLRGNHDSGLNRPMSSTHDVGGWTIGHGHVPIAAAKTIFGHVHPAIRAESVAAPCFLVGARTIVLPAFSNNAAGWNVASGASPPECRDRSLRCVVGLDGDWYDFGPIGTLASRMRAPR
jgi:putative SbcD/Mre11-related phosphoesterase